jgi:TetR/AcrR family transcriptional regulator, regulator of mycofactocin system
MVSPTHQRGSGGDLPELGVRLAAVAKAEGGARERKKRATRAQLEEAAYGLFSQQGYDATTVDEISEAASVSPRTFFRYFATKEDVVFGAGDETADHLRAAMAQAPGDDKRAVVEALLAFSTFLDTRRDAVLSRRQLMADNPSLQGRGRLVEDGWAGVVAGMLAERSGTDEPTFEQTVLAGCAVGVLSAAVHEWHTTGATAPLTTFTERALRVVGLC